MALRSCKECGKQVSPEAKACPGCGANPPKQTSIFTWIVLGFIVLWVLTKIIAGILEPSIKPAPAAAIPDLPQVPVTPLTAKELKDIEARKEKDFQAELKAQAKRRKSEGVTIGMTQAEVIASKWGKPSRINTTTNARGVREQWVYGDRNYLYFQDGLLTTIQN